MRRALLTLGLSVLVAACSPGGAGNGPAGGTEPRRIVSLDYCADQYVLRFADRQEIAAVSPDADARFSYMRARAKGLPQVRPRTADILILQPDLVVRSYGGEPGIADALERAGVPVLQVGFPTDISEVRAEVRRIGAALGKAREAKALSDAVGRRIGRIAKAPSGAEPELLYMTPAGVTSGPGTLVNDMIEAAGYRNFQTRAGWNPLPLERLAYDRPDVVAAAFFESATNHVDNWSAARHPVARAQLAELPVVPLEGAWTSCGGWFLIDTVEALAAARGAPV